MKKIGDKDSKLGQVELLSWLLDSAFKVPGTSIRVGIDGIIGLIPGIGDSITNILSLYIVFVAYRRGATAATILKMVKNVVIDTVIGVIPILGDLFDVTWKANQRNLALLQADLSKNVGDRKPVSRSVLITITVVLLITLLFVLTLTVVGLITLFSKIF